MSVFESRLLDLASPDRARSLLTVLAAISSARSSEAPRSSWLSLMCSYWRARFVPFFTARGGMATSSFDSVPLPRCGSPGTRGEPAQGIERDGAAFEDEERIELELEHVRCTAV